VELDPQLVASGRERAAHDGVDQVEFIVGDAAVTDAYVGAVPAQIVLVCGVFGNITDADIHRTVAALPQLCAARASVIWTRGTFAPDLTPTIRGWFAEAGFSELTFIAVPETTMAVGVHRLESSPRSIRAGRRLFTFLPRDQRPSTLATQGRR
jgi:hypothetical protein